MPLRQQLAEQIVFLITTGKLRSGQRLPSVREVARRLKDSPQHRQRSLSGAGSSNLGRAPARQPFGGRIGRKLRRRFVRRRSGRVHQRQRSPRPRAGLFPAGIAPEGSRTTNSATRGPHFGGRGRPRPARDHAAGAAGSSRLAGGDLFARGLGKVSRTPHRRPTRHSSICP